MKDTKSRIREYQNMLPNIRGKLMSAVVFLLISAMMITSASFAWLTVSLNPEVMGISTSIAANGNLEVALSNPEGTEPNESAVGDSGLGLAEKNLTWGNLVNLSDPSYGLEKLVLRPATLNASSLLDSPLYSAKYGPDGRIEQMTSTFAYTNYDSAQQKFLVPLATKYGVRAISSVTYTYDDVALKGNMDEHTAISGMLGAAQDEFIRLITDNITAISAIMGAYLTDELNNTESDFGQYVPTIWKLLHALETNVENTIATYVRLANLQATVGKKGVIYDAQTLLNTSEKTLQSQGIKLRGWDQLRTYYPKMLTQIATVDVLNEKYTNNKATILWKDGLNAVVAFLVDIDSTMVDGKTVKELKADKSNAISTILGTSNHTATLQKGFINDYEAILGTSMSPKTKISIKYGITVSLNVTIFTNAGKANPRIDHLPNSLNDTREMILGSAATDKSLATAADTFGMAIDFWVRSNAQNDYLTLEGNVITMKQQKTDEEGNLYFRYKVSQQLGDGTTAEQEIEVYKDKDGKYFNLDTGEEITDLDTSKLAKIEETVIVGYEGVNRVWEDGVISDNATTQGNGSCYVFYADTPQDQAQALEILGALTIVFMDDAGNPLAYADLDSDSAYAESGRVTVPIKLRSNSQTITNSKGEQVPVITPLTQGAAKRITALIYIDGTQLGNTDVLSNENIEGRLNFQFGTITDLEAIVDDGIYNDTISITGKVDETKFDWAGNPLTTGVHLLIDGLEPQKVEANFIRMINTTQGSRQETITFTKGTDGQYSATARFDAPGTYVLRSVWIDGVEYLIDKETDIRVDIAGFSISSLSWDYGTNHKEILTARAYESVGVNLTFAGGIIPNKVQGFFGNSDNQQVLVNFKYDASGNWKGTAQFSTSGTYSLQYILVDGDYYEVPTTMQKTISLSLGLQAKVQVETTVFEDFIEAKDTKVWVEILDNKGEALENLQLGRMDLQYMRQGSSLAESGLHTQLEWKAEDLRYAGTFHVKDAGAYQFGYITIGDNIIETAVAPVITAIPKVPPTFVMNLTPQEQLVYGDSVYIGLVMKDSAAVSNGNMYVTYVAVDENGNAIPDREFTIAGSKSTNANLEEGQEYWIFELPKVDEERLGTWLIKEISIIGAYNDKTGEISTEENPLIIDLSDKNYKTTVDKFTVSVSEETTGGVNDGESIKFTTEFLKPIQMSNLKLLISGVNGPLDTTKLSNVKLTYYYDVATEVAKSLTGYDAGTKQEGHITNDIAGYQNSLSAIANKTYVFDESRGSLVLDTANSSSQELALQGTYYVRVEFTYGGKNYVAVSAADGNYNLPSGTQKVDFDANTKTKRVVDWKAPVVTITGVSQITGANSGVNKGADDVRVVYSGSLIKYEKTKYVAAGLQNAKDSFSATVYLNAQWKNGEKSNGFLGAGAYDYTKNVYVNSYQSSSVTTMISGIEKATAAELLIAASGQYDTSIVKGGSQTTPVSFKYTGNGTSATASVGTYSEQRDGTGNYNVLRYVLGNGATGTHVKVTGTYNGVAINYVFELENYIIINNPY